MSFTLIIDDSARLFKVITNSVLQAQSQTVLDMLSDVDTFNAKTPLTIFSVTQTQGPPNERYNYYFKAKDLREWNQELRMDGPASSETTMNFNIPDFWKLSEFALHRPIRDRVVEWVSAYGLVSISHVWK